MMSYKDEAKYTFQNQFLRFLVSILHIVSRGGRKTKRRAKGQDGDELLEPGEG